MGKSEYVLAARRGFAAALPVTTSYLFVGMAYGMMMRDAGYGWQWSLLASCAVYTGAFQFVLITFLAQGEPMATVVLTALLMNSRQTFYSLTFVEEFKKMGAALPYMIHTMTDETYAVNCALLQTKPDSAERRRIMLFVALFSRIAWMTGAVAGGIAGQLVPFSTEGIDFCMTALFVTIFIDQWKGAASHAPALVGLAAGALMLLVLGPQVFMLPAIALSCVALLAVRRFRQQKGDTDA